MSTPNDIEVMLHYYTSPVGHPRIHASAVRDAVERFVNAGLLVHKNDTPTTVNDLNAYEVTKGGRMYVEALCAVPIPTQQWVMPRVQRTNE